MVVEAKIVTKATDEKKFSIDMTLQGARNTISVGKGVIRALGCPTHISLKISDSKDSISIFPCDEDDIMAFHVPEKLLNDHHCVMRIFSKRFVQGIMLMNHLDSTKTYNLVGEYLKDQNTAVFFLNSGATLRGKKCEDENG